jgi:hypothetical protein
MNHDAVVPKRNGTRRTNEGTAGTSAGLKGTNEGQRRSKGTSARTEGTSDGTNLGSSTRTPPNGRAVPKWPTGTPARFKRLGDTRTCRTWRTLNDSERRWRKVYDCERTCATLNDGGYRWLTVIAGDCRLLMPARRPSAGTTILYRQRRSFAGNTLLCRQRHSFTGTTIPHAGIHSESSR